MTGERFTADAAESLEQYLDSLAGHFRNIRKTNIALKDSVTGALVSQMGKERFIELKEDYTNNKLREIVLDEYNAQKTIETPGKFIQRYEPVYMKPVSRTGRAQFYAPFKQIGTVQMETFRFNIIVLWIVSLILYIALYFKLFKKAMGFGKRNF